MRVRPPWKKCDDLRRLILRFAEEQKPIAAAIAPLLWWCFGKLGLLKGKKATCYPGFEQYLKALTALGRWWKETVILSREKGPGAAMEFALAVVELLQGKDKVAELKEAGDCLIYKL